MRLLVLASIPPDFRHFRAGQTVLAELLVELAKAGVTTGVAVAAAEPMIATDQKERLQAAGVTIVESEAFTLLPVESVPSLQRKIYYLKSLASTSLELEYPCFLNPEAACAAIEAFQPDAVLLFWDSWFEYLLPRLVAKGIPCYGYLARPPHAAGQTNLDRFANPLRRAFTAAYLARAERRHIRRVRLLRNAANICALDAAWYTVQGIPSRYISNTWSDAYATNWRDMRIAAEKRRTGLHILGNIGGLNATGNRFGIEYLGGKVVPFLREKLEGEWTINICGRFELPQSLKDILSDPHVALRGFVPDIDEEVAGNSIFLLLNNAGPYTGGYTRVIYAFSSGSCLIAHRRLADSMPELVHNENCLLGETPQEIAGLIQQAARDVTLRERLGYAARATYERDYAPRHVAKKLMGMISES